MDGIAESLMQSTEHEGGFMLHQVLPVTVGTTRMFKTA